MAAVDLTPELIADLLRNVDVELSALNAKHHDVLIAGGAAVALVWNDKRVTNDVDVVSERMTPELRKAVARVGRDYGLGCPIAEWGRRFLLGWATFWFPEDLLWGASLVPSSGVCSVGVVVVQVLVEVASQPGDFGCQVASVTGFPALFEDGEMDSFHTAVGLGSARSDEPMLRSQFLDGVAEHLGTKLRSIVRHHCSQFPTPPREVRSDPASESAGPQRCRIAGVVHNSAQVMRRRHIDSGVLPHCAFHTLQAPYIETVHLYQLTRGFDLQMLLG